MLDKAADAYIENRTFDELSIGETASSCFSAADEVHGDDGREYAF